MQVNPDWTTQKVHTFLEWDHRRKGGKLGEPVVFNGADDLMKRLQ